MNRTEIWLRMKTVFSRKRLDRDLQDEMAFHLAMKQQKLHDQGATDAHLAAKRAFGNVTHVAEETRAAWSLGSLEIVWNDLRYAGRMLRKSPALTAVIVVSLALGIGANTAIFSVLDSVLLKMLPVDHPEQLVLLKWTAKGWPQRIISDLEGSSFKDESGLQGSYSFSHQVFEYIRDHNHVFDSTVAAVANTDQANVGLNGSARPAVVVAVSGNFFQGLRVTPAAGRAIADNDNKPGAPAVAMASYAFWQRYLGGELSAIGKTITLNGAPVTLIGVAPRNFFGIEPGEAPDVWVPEQYEVETYRSIDHMDLHAPKTWYLEVVGRLKPGITVAQASSEVKLLSEQVLNIGSAEVPRDQAPAITAIPGARGIDGLRRRFSTSLYLLMGMVGLVLLIACANVAALLLAKATSRRQEIAVRISLGAPRSRLVRQLLTESVVLALSGGAAGLLFANFARQALVALIQTGREADVPMQSDTRVLLFTFLVSIACGILFGLLPALRSTRSGVYTDLKLASGKAIRHSFGAGKALVSAQVALCLLLLIGAGLLLGTLNRLQRVNLGFDRENLISFRVFPGQNGYKDARLTEYYDDLQRNLESIPGVHSVALSQLGPVGQGSSSTTAVIVGYGDQHHGVEMWRHKVSPGYFSTLGIPIVLGRDFTNHDVDGAPLVAIVNQRFVREYMHGGNPIGRQFGPGDVGPKTKTKTIVGVVGDVKYASIRDEVPPTFYLPYKQDIQYASFMTYLVRTSNNPKAVMGEIQRAALRVTPGVPVVGMKTENEVIDASLFVERIFADLSAAFGALALLLACVGLYGTIGYTVTQRTNEIGVRMALGATRERILAMIVRETLIVVVAGIALGLPLTWYATQVLKAQLFGLTPHDASTILWSLAAILLVTILAGLQPARRAAKVDPMVALRYE